MTNIKLPPYPVLGPAFTAQQVIHIQSLLAQFACQAVRMNLPAPTTTEPEPKPERRPFDLEAAKRGEPLVTRDGRSAKFVAYVPESETYPVVAVVDKGVTTYNAEGLFQCEGCASVLDLFMAPKQEATR